MIDQLVTCWVNFNAMQANLWELSHHLSYQLMWAIKITLVHVFECALYFQSCCPWIQKNVCTEPFLAEFVQRKPLWTVKSWNTRVFINYIDISMYHKICYLILILLTESVTGLQLLFLNCSKRRLSFVWEDISSLNLIIVSFDLPIFFPCNKGLKWNLEEGISM